MAFVPVPKDLNRVKTKVMFNLTKRQLICFSMPVRICAIVASMSMLVLPWITPAAPETTFCPRSKRIKAPSLHCAVGKA